MKKRQRSVPHTLEGNIAAERARLEDELSELKPGPEYDAIKKKLRELDIAGHMTEWLRSPGLKPPE